MKVLLFCCKAFETMEFSVVGTPGEGFGACGEGFFRFSTFGDPADTREAAARLLKLLSDH